MASNGQGTREVWIIGGGNGAKRYLTRQAAAALKHADAVFCRRELLSVLRELGVPEETYREVVPEKGRLAERIESLDADHTAVLLSGDPGEHQVIGEMVEELRAYRTVIVPGVTDAQILSARFGIAGAEALYITDCRAPKVMKELLRHRMLFLKEPSNLAGICAYLTARGLGRTEVCAGEMLGKSGEGVVRGRASDLQQHPFSEHVSAFLIKHDADRAAREELSGLDAILISRLGIQQGDTLYLLGTISYPCALTAADLSGDGMVFAVSGKSSAADELAQRARDEGNWNLKAICGTLPVSLGHLEEPDAVLLVGEEKKHHDIIQIVKSRNPQVRMVIVTETLETAAGDLETLKVQGFTTEVMKLSLGIATDRDDRHTFRGMSECLILTARPD